MESTGLNYTGLIRNTLIFMIPGISMEPLTNIINGLGIFSAFNCDSVFFDVVAQ